MSYVVKIRVATDDYYVAAAFAKEATRGAPPATGMVGGPSANGLTVLAVGPEEPRLMCPRCERERLEKAP